MVLPPLHKSLAELADRVRCISLNGVKGDNLSVNTGAGGQPVFVTILCRVSREAFAHESRGEGSTGGITPELCDSIGFVTLHLFYAAPILHNVERYGVSTFARVWSELSNITFGRQEYAFFLPAFISDYCV